MMERTGAQIIVRLLQRQGIRLIPGIPGGATLPIYDALARQDTIRHVLCRHEQGAGFVAQGMARVTGQPAVCLATSGPGATNLLTSIADAHLDSIPLIAITGQVPRDLAGTDAFQEVQTTALARPITRTTFAAGSAAELLDLIPRAFALASTGRPGPVLIDVPKDVQMETARFERWPEPGRAGAPPRAGAAELDAAAEMINAARRPILFLGGGVIHAGAADLAVKFAEKTSSPVVTSLMARGAIPADHELALGMPGMHGARCTNLAMEECDLLMAIGARFDDRLTGRIEGFCPRAKILHVDLDPAELGKILAPHLGITGDARDVVEDLLERTRPAHRGSWRGRVDQLKSRFPLARPDVSSPRSPCGLIRHIGRGLPADAIIATDVGQHQMWTAQAYPFRHPRCWLTSGGLGTMGFGLPAAIGAALARPDRTVACFTGDGSLLMNIQELATLAEENLPVKIILFDNASLGLVRQQQSLFCAGRTFASDYQRPTDFARIARDFGVPSLDLGAERDSGKGLERFLSQPGPALLRAPINPEEMVYPMVPPGGTNAEMLTRPEAASV
jgi:acetolactate synthase-1/2/3 large subunit